MADYHLLISNPPHGDVDLAAAGKCLGWLATEVRMRAHHPAPEIWLAETDHDAIRAKGERLVGAGLNVVPAPASVLLDVAVPEHISKLALSESGFSASFDSGGLEIPRTTRTVAVAVQPSREAQQRAGTAGGATGALFLDLYVAIGDGWRTGRLTSEHVDLGGLGELKQTSFAGNIRAILDELREHFEDAWVDERLMNVNYHYAMVSGMAMPKLLGDISPELAHVDPFDLASRLALLTTQ
jgi:hypothetical protein